MPIALAGNQLPKKRVATTGKREQKVPSELLQADSLKKRLLVVT